MVPMAMTTTAIQGIAIAATVLIVCKMQHAMTGATVMMMNVSTISSSAERPRSFPSAVMKTSSHQRRACLPQPWER
jgi:hypothetical protein